MSKAVVWNHLTREGLIVSLEVGRINEAHRLAERER